MPRHVRGGSIVFEWGFPMNRWQGLNSEIPTGNVSGVKQKRKSPMKARERRRLTVDSIRELMSKPALTLREAADVLDVSTDLLWKKLHAGDGPPHFKIGRVTYILTADLQTWLQRLRDANNVDHPQTATA
jgi:predicted DNA-binding transcriptional regulator AlpA